MGHRQQLRQSAIPGQGRLLKSAFPATPPGCLTMAFRLLWQALQPEQTSKSLRLYGSDRQP